MKKATLSISFLAIILCSCEKDATKEIKYLNYQTSDYFIQNDSIYYDLNSDKIDDIKLISKYYQDTIRSSIAVKIASLDSLTMFGISRSKNYSLIGDMVPEDIIEWYPYFDIRLSSYGSIEAQWMDEDIEEWISKDFYLGYKTVIDSHIQYGWIRIKNLQVKEHATNLQGDNILIGEID